MEDRLTSGLYLEMTDRAVDAYASERVPAVLAQPGVQRATWWRNVHRDRDDLPRVLPEFDHLGVYEVDDRFAPPATPTDVTGHHFRRTPRPGQGVITGNPTIGLSLVLISPKDPDRAQELRDWGDFVHIRHIAEVGVPGYAMITPFENATGGDPRFMHFYEMDTDDPETSYRAMTPLVGERIGDPSTDAWKRWAFHPQLRIMYVNTFARVGSQYVTEPSTDFFDVVARQRAYRAFADTPLSDDDVAAVLGAATYAPSAENKQPWEFIVVRDADARATIGDLTRRAWETTGRAFSEGRLSPKTFADVHQGATGGIAAAPVLVVVCADNERGLEQTVPSSIFPAIQNLLLAATARGLGSALTTITIGYRAELAELLALPRTSCPSPSSRSVIRLARSAGRSATRSRATRTASATACRGPATPDREPTQSACDFAFASFGFSSRTTSTGHGACRNTCSLVEPSISRFTPVRP